tara:strand:- start:635 stop:808 length:174 start_codon:yes stop_codon:yes gene_type:complete
MKDTTSNEARATESNEARAITAEAHAAKFNEIYYRWKHKKLMQAAIKNNKIKFIEIK